MSTPKPNKWKDPVLLWKLRLLMMIRIDWQSFWFLNVQSNFAKLDTFTWSSLLILASRRKSMNAVETSKPRLVSWIRRWARASVSRKHDTISISISWKFRGPSYTNLGVPFWFMTHVTQLNECLFSISDAWENSAKGYEPVAKPRSHNGQGMTWWRLIFPVNSGHIK